MSMFINSNKNLFIILFFSIFFLIGVFVFSDYGLSIDEDNTRILGFISLENISTMLYVSQCIYLVIEKFDLL